MANTWQQFKTAAANSNPYEDEEERKRREGAINTDSSLSTWQKYKAYANGGEYVEPDKELKKQLKADAKAYGKYKDDDSWKGNAELYASSKPLFDEYMKEASEASKQAAQTPAISMADLNPNRTFKPQADKHPAMIQSAVDARNNELMQSRLKELETKKAGNNTAEKDYFNSLPKAAQDAANNYNKAQQTANLDLLEQSEKDLMKAVGNDEEAYTKALTAAGSIYNGERVNALNESETLEYMQLKINTLPANQRKAVDKIMRGQALYFEGAPAMERGKDPAIRQNYYKEYKTLLKEGYDDLLKSGMSKEEADEYNEIAKRFANYQSTQKYSEKFAVDNSQSVDNNILKAAGKTAKGLAYDAVSFIPAGISGIFTDDINDPAGLGSRDIYARANKLNNAIEYANSQINQNVFGEDHPVLQQAYGIGASMAESAMAKAASYIPYVGKYIGTSAFFGKGYDAQYKSARERGLNPEQARLEGIAAGVAEFVTEEIELGIFNKTSKWLVTSGTLRTSSR